MTNAKKRADLAEQARELFRVLEAAPRSVETNLLQKYAGEWIVLDRGKVVAHGKDGAKVAEEAPVDEYPFGELVYVPTLEEQEEVRILVAPRRRESAS